MAILGFNWKILTSWMVLGAFIPTLGISAPPASRIPSLSDHSVLNKVMKHYNARLEIKPSFYSFAKANLSSSDYSYLVTYLKKNKATHFPRATVIGKQLRFDGGSIVEFSRSPDSKLLVKIDGESIKTLSERTLLSDLVKHVRKKSEKGALSAFSEFLLPEAHAFVGALLLLGLGGAVYSYQHEMRNSWEDLVTPQSEMTQVKYLQDAREHLYSCEREKENWEDNWYEQDWFFGGVNKDIRPDLSNQEGKLKFINSLANTDSDLIRATRKQLLDCKNTPNARFEGHEAMVQQDVADASAVRASDPQLLEKMKPEMKDNLCRVWDEWDSCLSEVKALKRKYGTSHGMPLSEVSQVQEKSVDRAPAIIENPSNDSNGVQSQTTGATLPF